MGAHTMAPWPSRLTVMGCCQPPHRHLSCAFLALWWLVGAGGCGGGAPALPPLPGDPSAPSPAALLLACTISLDLWLHGCSLSVHLIFYPLTRGAGRAAVFRRALGFFYFCGGRSTLVGTVWGFAEARLPHRRWSVLWSAASSHFVGSGSEARLK
eukprot:TRINITY_DN229_c0_g1_i12.p2 TRINITY_DN229_c0_g1~~TRINITY_DN229_c0_g1_i12.p2  ORF type:complete len:155 (+),score=1.01 TRINITY_DN229_c0_g1_i12:279-743(+)